MGAIFFGNFIMNDSALFLLINKYGLGKYLNTMLMVARNLFKVQRKVTKHGSTIGFSYITFLMLMLNLICQWEMIFYLVI